MMELCTTEINKFLKQEVRFLGAFPCNRIPKTKLRPPYGIILNTDRDDQPGSHWTSVFVSADGHGEYFDSFAFPPLKQEIVDFLTLQDTCFCISQVVIQHPSSVACGHFAIGFILARLKGISFENYLTKFESNNLLENDQLILKWNSSFQIATYAKYVQSLMRKVSSIPQAKNHASCQWSCQ